MLIPVTFNLNILKDDLITKGLTDKNLDFITELR